MNLTNIIHQEKVYAKKRRNRTILWLRLRSGIRELTARPWKGLSVALLCIAFILVWNIRDTLCRPFSNSIPLFSIVCGYLIAVSILLLFLLLLLGLLILLGMPYRAKAIEDNLLQIGLSNRYNHAPVLISRRRVKNTEVSVMAFYSLGVGMERWEKQGVEIQDALNVNFVESIKYGGRDGRNRNIIVITAAPGVGAHREDTLYDDEI